MQQLVCRGIIGNLLGIRVPFDSTAHCHRCAGHVREAGGTMAVLKRAQRRVAALNAIQEVSNKIGRRVLADTKVTVLDIVFE